MANQTKDYERYKLIYNCAEAYLKDLVKNNPFLNKEILEAHLNQESQFNNLQDAFKRLIESQANRSMMAKVINVQKNEKEIAKLLFDFNFDKVIGNYRNPEELFIKFKQKFDIKNTTSRRNLWKQFAKGILSGAKFMKYFKNKKEFDQFIQNFTLNKYTKAALPMLLSKEIEGFGFALACDFLKELGYKDYPKPDVHIIAIFHQLGLSENTQYSAYKTVIEMAEVVHETPYKVDKIFWLIGSGRFYLAKDNTGKEVSIGRNREKFIKKVKKEEEIDVKRIIKELGEFQNKLDDEFEDAMDEVFLSKDLI